MAARTLSLEEFLDFYDATQQEEDGDDPEEVITARNDEEFGAEELEDADTDYLDKVQGERGMVFCYQELQ